MKRLGETDEFRFQHERARAMANGIRGEMVKEKRRLKREPGRIEGLLHSPPDHISRMKLRALLLAIPGIGPRKIDGYLERSEIPLSRQVEPVGNLSERQRGLLAQALQERRNGR